MHSDFWGNRANNGAGPVLELASELPLLPVVWLWEFWLARGKLHVFAGPPSTGKTTLALAVAATLTNGGQWPDGSNAPQGRVLIWTCEDGVEDTVMPRLAASGANLSNVYILRVTNENGRRRPFDFKGDLPRLAAKVRELGDVALIIIDSIAQVVSGNSNSNTQVRKDLDPLVAFSEQTGVAILGLTHVNKGSKKKDPLERVNGSTAFGAVARLVWIVARDESDRAGDGIPRSVLVRGKSNLGPTDGGFAYHIEPVSIPVGRGVVNTSKIGWDETLGGSPREILNEVEGGASILQPDSRLQEAKDFLATMLSAGPVPSETVRSETRHAGMAWATVRRAKEELGLRNFRPVNERHWYWSLNGDAQNLDGAHSYLSLSHPVPRSIFDTVPRSGQRAGPPNMNGPTIALEQVEQVEQVEPPQFEIDEAIWTMVVRACVNTYREVRQSRPYVDDLDEYSVRIEAIDCFLSETPASDTWKARAREQLMNLNFAQLADNPASP